MEDSKEVSPPLSIKCLPFDIIFLILLKISDPKSLHAAILSCRLFFCCFLDKQGYITSQVLRNHVGVGVLPEAVAAIESSQLRLHDENFVNEIYDFRDRHLVQRQDLRSSLVLSKALLIGQLHYFVTKLTDMFLLDMFGKGPLSDSNTVVTRQERSRIERAFYHFEVYCNLFRNKWCVGPTSNEEYKCIDSIVSQDQTDLFFRNFAPWEIEQLGCIHDFLYQVVSPAFADIADHDILWGSWEIGYGNGLGVPFIQYLLSLGLEKVYQITQAHTSEKRYDLIHTERYPPTNSNFLWHWLSSNGCLSGLYKSYSPMKIDSMDRVTTLKVQSFFDDPDHGPLNVWRWAHARGKSWPMNDQKLVYSHECRLLRQWAYVLWDQSRLFSMGIFSKPFDWHGQTELESRLVQDNEQSKAYLKRSWQFRARILKRGGRGWWSWDDYSKVQWPKAGGYKPRGNKGRWQKPYVPLNWKKTCNI